MPFRSLLYQTSNAINLISPALLKQCKSISQANLVHQQAIVQGLLTHFSINLVSTYLALNAPSHALSLLRRLTPSSDAVYSWNALIRRALRLGLLHRSLSLFRTMRRLSWSPDHYTYPFIFKACGELPSFSHGSCVHAVVVSTGFDSNVFVCNATVAMYGRCGALDYARQVFDEMLVREIFDLVSWNSITAVFIQSGDSKRGIELFRRMWKECDFNVRPDAVSLVNVLPACASMGDCLSGKQVHGFSVRSGLFDDVYVANSLVDMYAKCGMMNEANKVFDRMEIKDVVSWNSMVTGYSQIGKFEEAVGLFEKMSEENIELDVVSWSAVIAGYSQRGLGYEALNVFRQMQVCGSNPNEVTLVSLLSGCASIGALLHGKETHCHAIKCILNFDRSDPREDGLVLNAMIDMYTKCEDISAGRAIFDSISPKDRNVVTWTAMIGGYAQHGEANDGLELFSRMIKEDRLVKPNAFTISCALMACARLAALRSGRQIHAYVLRNQYDFDVLHVANCLVDMYSKSGDIGAARVVFDNMKRRNDVSWTSLMTGYGMHGQGEEAVKVFDQMSREGLDPDGVTLLVLLYACSHSGMVDEGMRYFSNMSKDFGVAPGEEHYASMVDLLSRAGRFDDATKLIEDMPMKPGPIVWVGLLSGCRVHANVELGEYAAGQLMELESESDGSYTLLSNIYANARRWKDVTRIRSLMKHSGVRKRPGCSWVQGKKGTETFFVGDRSHRESKQIYGLLSELIRRIKVAGYVPETSFALHDVDDEEKGDLLFEHSEKLALAYGILTSAPGAPIRITKNLRVCGDCHTAITYISNIIHHEIILRDSSRFHHFKNGSCSCKGYW
ncbi:pentatricopeptide repeat-containing protein At5g16860 [Mercurialis annua]|uniref:pentatricopeptide repeat-containing protein At5g16860 n=1 Tax=Mercurialis annua TaxID=3986 RepID=UPI0021605B77|nr:pentatricopeptide repeat-containing protein At5g16860 [Mercurialis annua]